MTTTQTAETLTAAELRAADREGRLRELVDDLGRADRLKELDALLPVLRELYAASPRSYVLEKIVGTIMSRVISRAQEPGRKREAAKAVRTRRKWIAEERARPSLDNGEYWALVERRHPDGCPSCGERIVGYAQRLGEWRWRCGWQTCRHEESMISYWREQQEEATSHAA